MALGARIKERLAEVGWEQVDLLRAVPDLNAGTLSALITRDSEKSRFSEAIAEALDVSHRWLLEGVLPKQRAAGLRVAGGTAADEKDPSTNQRLRGRASPSSNIEPAPNIRPGGIPLISWVRAGEFCEAVDNFAPGDSEEQFFTTHAHGPSSYALRVRGDSMLNPSGEDSFREGDVILVDPDREPRHRSLVIVRLPDENEATFKQLLIDGPRRYIQALNPQWPNRVTELPTDATICGVVFALDRRYA